MLDTLEIIRSELPVSIWETIGELYSLKSQCNEIDIPGFQMWHVTNLDKLKYVWDRKLICCETKTSEDWLREKIAFIADSIAASTDGEIWQAYCVTESGRVFFVIDAGRKKYCKGPFP
jgi:hypothetical protein